MEAPGETPIGMGRIEAGTENTERLDYMLLGRL